MKKILALIVVALMFAFAASAIAFQQPDPPPVTIGSDVNQNSSGVVTTPGFGAPSYDGAQASFNQTSDANYTAKGSNISGTAAVSGSATIGATFGVSNGGNTYTSTVTGAISNNASASATDKNGYTIDADISGKGSLATSTISSMGLNSSGAIVNGNGAFGQTNTTGNFSYALDPTVNVSGQGATSATGSSVVTTNGSGYTVTTSSTSNASGSVIKP